MSLAINIPVVNSLENIKTLRQFELNETQAEGIVKVILEIINQTKSNEKSSIEQEIKEVVKTNAKEEFKEIKEIISTELKHEIELDNKDIDKNFALIRNDIKHLEDSNNERMISLRTELKKEIEKTEANIKGEIISIRGEMTLIKWMLGFVLAGVGSLILKQFF